MTILYTEHFKLDLSHLNVKFSEENSFFEKDLIKQQSFPFKIPKERGFIPFFEFIGSDNSATSNVLLKSTLFRQGVFYEAELMVLSIKKEIEVVIYFAFDKLTLFDKPLKSLPWETIKLPINIFDYASNIKALDYPDTIINFVQVYEPEKHKDYEYGQYKNDYTTTGSPENGNFINHCENGVFSEKKETPYGFSFTKMNEMRPFIYKRKIVAFIFSQIDYTVVGDFITDSSISKALQYHDNSIFITNKNYNKEGDLQFNLSETNIILPFPTPYIYNNYIHLIGFPSKYASYKIKVSISGEFPESDYLQCELFFSFHNILIKKILINNSGQNTSIQFDREFVFDLEVPQWLVHMPLNIKIECPEIVKDTIEGTFEVNGTLRPLYLETISLSDLLPDITVGEIYKGYKRYF